MNLEFSALSSGSSGNCFYVRNPLSKVAVLIDAGMTAKKTEERLTSIGRSIKEIKGIFITHEHSDHIAGADVLARKHKIPVYATKKTFLDRYICREEDQILIKNNETTTLGGMRVEAFSKTHGAADPVSYNVTKENKKISIITDAGMACKNITSNINESNILCMESNHDPKMVSEGTYPAFLKKWITSDTGHLSNQQSALAVLEHASTKLRKVVLSHLSSHNNTPHEALHTYKNLIKERSDLRPQITVSTRYAATPIMKV